MAPELHKPELKKAQRKEILMQFMSALCCFLPDIDPIPSMDLESRERTYLSDSTTHYGKNWRRHYLS
jgi:hypothetical protein